MSASSRTGLFGRPRPTEEERLQALEDPGVPWRDWFYFSFLKVWVCLGFLILDGLVAGAFAESRNFVGLFVALLIAVYLEFVLFQYLWIRPGPDDLRASTFAPSWYRPARVGRWTPETFYPERFRMAKPSETGPDPNEFL